MADRHEHMVNWIYHVVAVREHTVEGIYHVLKSEEHMVNRIYHRVPPRHHVLKWQDDVVNSKKHMVKRIYHMVKPVYHVVNLKSDMVRRRENGVFATKTVVLTENGQNGTECCGNIKALALILPDVGADDRLYPFVSPESDTSVLAARVRRLVSCAARRWRRRGRCGHPRPCRRPALCWGCHRGR